MVASVQSRLSSATLEGANFEVIRDMSSGLKELFSKGKARLKGHARVDSLSTVPTEPLSKSDFQQTEPSTFGVRDWVECDDAEVDICFVHGLTGNRDSTWTAKGRLEPWPKILLPSALPNSKARIFTYGYDAYLIRWGAVSTNQLTDHATNFLQKVTADRERKNALRRPLVIVAHSLGGLVCKQAILQSKDSPESHLNHLYNMTRGIVFMGTPHAGSWLADWGKIPADVFGIVKSSNTSLLRVLQTKDELLLSVNQSFLALLRRLREGQEGDKRIHVTCFFEELGYPKVGPIVSKASATFASDPPISVHSNHSEMVKFVDAGDDGFQSVAGELRRWVTDIR